MPSTHDERAAAVLAAQSRLRKGILAVLVVIAIGVVGYTRLEGWTVVDALYMTVTTLTTVGFMEVHPLSDAGRLFTVALLVSGVGSFFFLAGTFAEYVIGGALTGVVRSRRMQRQIDEMSGHQIVCGYGRVGEQVALDLASDGLQVVVVEKDPAALARLGDRFPCVTGDATDDAILARAGITRARGLVAASGEDTSNIVITLTARGLNPGIQIVARGGADETASKLVRAGADQVISPYRLAGRRIATQLQSPRVSDYLDLVMHSRDVELWLREVTVRARSRLDGSTLADCKLGDAVGITLLAVSEGGSGQLLTSPPPTLSLGAGDVLIVLGTTAQLRTLNALAGNAP